MHSKPETKPFPAKIPPPSPKPAKDKGTKKKPPGFATLGPVSDLERHLPSDWWRTLFNALYLQTDGDVVENDANTARDVDLLVGIAGIEPGHRVLDLCCGQGRHALELARRGYGHVHGIDRSRYLVRLARRRAAKLGLSVTFQEGDARQVRVPESSFDFVYLLGNSFGYFDREEDDAVVLEQIKRALKASGTLVIDLVDGEWMREHFERRSWEWIDQNHFVCRERSLTQDGQRLVSREVVVHSERGVIADQFYAERLYTRQQIVEMLERANFGDIRFHQEVASESTRNQDLGMMAKRLFLTSTAPAKIAKMRKSGPPFPDVTVIMGDPRLPDSVKLGGRFNAEDFATVDRLKEALSHLPAYRFSYLDNHAGLLSELRTKRPAFVFNLCDEGFNNDAFQELHLPAFLDMIGVPYTGAGPKCLGACYDKALVRSVAAALDVPVPLETFFDSRDQAATIPSIFPALIKPCFGDSSIGITQEAVVSTPEEAIAYASRLRERLPGRPLLIQEYLAGAEYGVAIIGNPGLGYTFLPVLEVDYSGLDAGLPPILSYESKWEPESPYWSQIKYREAQLKDEVLRKLTDHATLLFERLECRDYARFDFRADADGEIKLLEVNPNPGWCWDGKLNIMAGFAGLSYTDLLRRIIEAAQSRIVAGEAAAAAQAVPLRARPRLVAGG